MKRITIALFSLIAFSGCNLSDPVVTGNSVDEKTDAIYSAGANNGNVGLPGKGAALRLLGTAIAYEGTVPDIDGDGEDDLATCFDVDLLDAASGRKIGTATDCLSEITPVDNGLALIGTTIFRLPNGTFISRGSTTVQPVTTTAPTPITHTTGAIPMNGTNGVIHGTGAFTNFAAQVRLSGAVNLSKLDSDGEITFDCLFTVTPLRGRIVGPQR